MVEKLKGQILQLSQHKFASNVVEKCVQYGNSAERELIINEILGSGRDGYASYDTYLYYFRISALIVRN